MNLKNLKPKKDMIIALCLLIFLIIATSITVICSSKTDFSKPNSNTALIDNSSTESSSSSSEVVETSETETNIDQTAIDTETKEDADEKNPSTYPTLPYDEMARNGNKHKGEKLQNYW
ncbi:hypothetical protein [Lactococcus lactis]